MTQPTTRKELSVYMHDREIVSRFMDVLGTEAAANSYIQSVLILVASDEKLQDCTPKSIYASAMRAASLGLSCDKSLKQAWIIGYDVKVKAYKTVRDGQEIMVPEHWEKQAQFSPHYLGLYNLAMRTNRYWIIHVTPIYEGQRVLENTLTGLHLVEEDGLITLPVNPNASYRDVTHRYNKERKREGWLAYYKTKNGAEKSVYMSCEEIEQHARTYVKGYLDEKGNIKNPNWKEPEKRQVMEMKTTLRQLLSWADLTGKENAKLVEALAADTVDGYTEDNPEVTPGGNGKAPELKKSTGSIFGELAGQNPDPVKDATWKQWTELAARSDEMKIERVDVERGKTTDSDLLAYISELTPYVLDAEEQAAAA